MAWQVTIRTSKSTVTPLTYQIVSSLSIEEKLAESTNVDAISMIGVENLLKHIKNCIKCLNDNGILIFAKNCSTMHAECANESVKTKEFSIRTVLAEIMNEVDFNVQPFMTLPTNGPTFFSMALAKTNKKVSTPVSYTHLTLPTICSV
eukprot:TRINITY_DN26183_c0_g1_i2.p2 TRINITY_DN26183_c0_g1~~TRINITY_DN26183_c0_g1_i2.p2  ORF type:complete len:148 (-),score=10.77 TRINITY_DN26183_c0_g1_i2:36-479(-)